MVLKGLEKNERIECRNSSYSLKITEIKKDRAKDMACSEQCLDTHANRPESFNTIKRWVQQCLSEIVVLKAWRQEDS